MELHRSDSSGLNMVKVTESGDFLVNDVLYTQSIIVTADNVLTDWSANRVGELTVADFARFAELDPEILILGTGTALIFPEHRLLKPLVEQKCGYEVMSSNSACNTFNLLLGDGRKVVAALLRDR